MAITVQSEFNGAVNTLVNPTGYSPEVGSKWQDDGSFPCELNGAGSARKQIALSFGYNWTPASVSNNGTLAATFTPGNTGQPFWLEWRATSLLANGYQFGVTNAGVSALYKDYVLVQSGPTLSIAAHTVIITVQGNVQNVWLDGNTSASDISYTDGSSTYTSGFIGWSFDNGNNGLIDRIEWNDVVNTPSAPINSKVAIGSPNARTNNSIIRVSGGRNSMVIRS